jgi:two-component system cell cycle sensor histidine kinase/response regulator CckA
MQDGGDERIGHTLFLCSSRANILIRVSEEVMRAKVHSAVSQDRGPSQGGGLLRPRPTSPTRIALIDDDADILEALEQLLRGAGYDVSCFRRADRALNELDVGDIPDLIVLDLMLPVMNGWHFRIEQRKRPKLRDVPVIALTANVSSYAKAVDADAYITKPVNFNELEALIARLLLETERQRLLVKSIELERIHALGTLVASVAHEINNPLAYVLSSLELAARQVRRIGALLGVDARTIGELSQHLADSTDGAMRIASVVKLLSTFSRAEVTDADDVDVLRAVQAASRLARNQITRTTGYREDLAAVPLVKGNEGRLAQVVLNLLVNAAQAVSDSESERGWVGVATRVADGCVVIEVSDTGPGIEPKLLDQIFEPFFTTKPAGRGTGLGLNISRDIVSGMGGTLTVHSEPGQGATFVVKLPIAADAARPTKTSDAPIEGSTGSRQRILVVDDEPMIGHLVKSALGRAEVDVARSPREALKLATAHTYDFILCDFEMPEMNGVELYRRLVGMRPELQPAFILMTGHLGNDEVDAFARRGQVPLLYKPFSLKVLRECLTYTDGPKSSLH